MRLIVLLAGASLLSASVWVSSLSPDQQIMVLMPFGALFGLPWLIKSIEATIGAVVVGSIMGALSPVAIEAIMAQANSSDGLEGSFLWLAASMIPLIAIASLGAYPVFFED